MNESDRGEFAVQVMHVLCSVYHRQPSNVLATVYFDILRPFSMTDILGAAHVWMSNQEKWPAPVNLLEAVRAIVNRRPHLNLVMPDMAEEEQERSRVGAVLFKWLWLPIRIDDQIARMKSMSGDREQVESWWMKYVDRLLDSPEEVAQMKAEVEESKPGFALLLKSCQSVGDKYGRGGKKAHRSANV